MELNTSRKVANCAATQEFSSILWNSKVHYSFHISPLLVPILSQINPSIPNHSISLRSILILSTRLRLGLVVVSFLLSFPPISYIHSTSLTFVLHALCISSSLTWPLVISLHIIKLFLSLTEMHCFMQGTDWILNIIYRNFRLEKVKWELVKRWSFFNWRSYDWLIASFLGYFTTLFYFHRVHNQCDGEIKYALGALR
jgi:hypothetical protein